MSLNDRNNEGSCLKRVGLGGEDTDGDHAALVFNHHSIGAVTVGCLFDETSVMSLHSDFEVVDTLEVAVGWIPLYLDALAHLEGLHGVGLIGFVSGEDSRFLRVDRPTVNVVSANSEFVVLSSNYTGVHCVRGCKRVRSLLPH